MKRVIRVNRHLRKGKLVRPHYRWLVVDNYDKIASGIAGQTLTEAQDIANRLNESASDKRDPQHKYHKGKAYRVEDVEVVW